MAISVQIYSNANSTSRTVTFDFVGDILAANDADFTNVSASCNAFYFKVTASGTQDNGVAFPVKLVRSLSDLVLNKQKQRMVNTANAYTDIRSMVIDYTYDYINGHAANLNGSGCTYQGPLKFR